MDDNEWLKLVTRQDSWDVVVLGAGPAGAIAARQFAHQGHCVLLVEKSQFPRFKVCGGCLGGAALDVLEDLGLGDLPTKCGGVPLQRMRLASGGSIAEIERPSSFPSWPITSTTATPWMYPTSTGREK